MRLWILATEQATGAGESIASSCLRRARGLRRAGHEVLVVVADPRRPAGSEQLETEDEVEVLRFHRKDALHRYFGPEAALANDFASVVEGLLQDRGAPELIEVTVDGGVASQVLQRRAVLWPGFEELRIVARLNAPRFLAEASRDMPTYRLPGYWVGEMERFSLRAADALLCPSGWLADRLRACFDPGDTPIHVSPRMLEVPEAATTGPRRREELVYLGEIQHRDGVLALCRDLARRWREGARLRLGLQGPDGHDHPRAVSTGELLRRHHAEFVDDGRLFFVEDPGGAEQQTAVLARAHAVIVPSSFDAGSGALLAALAAGAVVLAARGSGAEELIDDGRTGLLYDPEEAGSFDRQLDRVLRMGDDELAALGAAAREAARDRCSAQAADEERRLLESLAESPRAPRPFPVVRPERRSSPSLDEVGEPDLLSVIVPYFELAETLPETLDSILATPHRPLEVIVVDDGSRDEASPRVLQEAEARPLVRVVRQENRGLPEARNRGFAESRGQFVAVLDADDLVTADYYSWALRVLRRYPELGFVGAWADCFGADQGLWPTWNPEPPYLLVHNTMNSSALVFRRRDLHAHGLNDARMQHGQEDYESVINLVANGCPGAAIPAALFRYRLRAGSVSHQYSTASQQWMYQRLAEKHADFHARHAPAVISLLNQNGPGFHFDNPTFEPPPVGPDAVAQAEQRLGARQIGLALGAPLDLIARTPLPLYPFALPSLRRSIAHTLRTLDHDGQLARIGPEDQLVADAVSFLQAFAARTGLGGALKTRRRARRFQRELQGMQAGR